MSKLQNDAINLSESRTWRAKLPEYILSGLPLTLFFQVGMMYAGVLLFILSLLASGEYARKWQNLRRHPLLLPVLSLSLVSVVVAIFQEKPEGEFWSGFWHYQTYLFLLPFLMTGIHKTSNDSDLSSGNWQTRAVLIFFAGALYASTVFYLNAFQLLPDNAWFRSYTVYQGNKSILLGILLAIAAAWMLQQWHWYKNYHVVRALSFLYVLMALLFFAKSRTASLIFILLCSMLLLRNFKFAWKSVLALCCALLAGGAGISYVANMPEPETCLATQMQQMYAHNPIKIMLQRGVCTVHQIRDFQQGKKLSEDGMRLEIYHLTSQLIAEKPWTGHGIAQWITLYKVKAKGMMSEEMTTPHNDYLLYTTELGIAGLLALLWIWCRQLNLARHMSQSRNFAQREYAMLLAMLGVTMMVGGMFNAILRDAVFGMAFMILLAIPLAGLSSKTEKI